MAAPSRTTQLNKIHKVLKKHYSAVHPDPNRSVFDHLVFACCLQNAHYDRAEEAFAALEHNFFDWNEIRVTTIRELSEVLGALPDPPAAANRVKRALQSIFEGTYCYDLEEMRKKNLGPAVEELKKIDGTTPFTIAYVTQAALGGHAIPVDEGAMGALQVVGVVNEKDLEAGVISGLERAIAKSKGVEFGSQLHQLGADFVREPGSSALHKILLEINPDARDELPKRAGRKRAASPDQRAASREAKRQRPRAQAEAPPKKPGAKKSEASEEKPASADESAASSKEPSAPKKKAPPPSKKKSSAKKGGSGKAKADAASKKSTSAGLSKRKPR
jgi:endonuclease-3